MGDKSKIVFEHLKSYIGYYFTIIAVFGSIWTIFTFYDKWKDERTEMRNEINILKQEKKSHKTLDSILIEEIYSLDDRISIIENNTSNYTKEIKGVKKSVLRYISKDEALSKEEFMRFIQEINGDSNIIYMYPYLIPKNKLKTIKP